VARSGTPKEQICSSSEKTPRSLVSLDIILKEIWYLTQVSPHLVIRGFHIYTAALSYSFYLTDTENANSCVKARFEWQ